MENNKLVIDVELNTEKVKEQLKEIELPKLKITLDDLEQKLIDYLYNLKPDSYDQSDIRILEILFNKKD